ncbi:MAG TPA: hypothetical protein VHW01_13275 [Polyangiaceae bacterium]|jgi:hypothetical protein|nr:hypothetical protein [Polyangiaceae bacterium]
MRTKTWVSPNGIRCAEVVDQGLKGETLIDMRDLSKWLTTIDASEIGNAAKREAVLRFQRDVAVLGPATAHRRAVALLREVGCALPDVFDRPLVHAVKDGK